MKFEVKNRLKVCLIISCSIMLIALIMSIAGYGIVFGIDFAGGLNIKYHMNEQFEQVDVETALSAAGISDYSISKAGDNNTELQIRIKEISDEGVQSLRAVLEQNLSQKYTQMNVDDVSVGYVGPVAGATLVKNAILSVLLASALMLVYIAFRFDLNSGLAAVFGLVHDVLIMLSFMVILRNFIQMNSTFIAAVLTIVGYSINNTIVIFDRIRENNRKAEFASSDSDVVVNVSIRESLGRTIFTTLTTLATIVCLYIFGVDSIKEFALPIIIGILSGVYSANMINGYIWSLLNKRLKLQKNTKSKVTKRA